MNAQQVRTQPFIDSTRGSGFAYFRISKSMLQQGKDLGIDTDEVLLYTLLRDRARLSYEHQNYDDDGRLFVYCTRATASAYFGWSPRKAVGLFHALEQHQLIREQAAFSAKGQQKASRIYLNLWSVPSLTFSQEQFDQGLFPALTVDTLFDMDIGDYYVLPKALLEEERYHGLSLRALLLYMLLLDRISLSERYGRMDANGLLWTTMDADLCARELGCSTRSLTRATAELEEIGLIERRAVSYAEKWRIYVRDFLPAAPQLQPNPDPCRGPGDGEGGAEPANGGADLATSALADKFAPLSRQNCTPVSPDVQASDAKSAVPEVPDLQPNKLSYTKTSENNPSPTTNILPLPVDQEVVMSADEEKRAGLLAMERQYRAMDYCCYSETVELIYLGLDEAEGDRAIGILDFCVDEIAAQLASPDRQLELGRDHTTSAEFLKRLSELDEFTVFLMLRKILPRWAEIKDRGAYVRRTLYLASRQHRQEAFFLRKSLENGSFGREAQAISY